MREPPKMPNYPPPPPPNLNPIPVDKLSIMYLILVHDHEQFVERIISALDEPQHTFVIHVDLKAIKSYQYLLKISKISNNNNKNVFVVENKVSQRVNWGGYSVVNATIQGMKYAWALKRPFDYLQLISGTSYPIKSNQAIREELAQNPGALYMEIIPQPTIPQDGTWFHYIECDDAIHRIWRLSPPRGTVLLYVC